MDATVTTRISIRASPQKVFTYLTDMHYMHLWNPQLRKVSDKKILKLGSRYQSETQVLGVIIKASNLITKFEPDKELQIENETGMVQYAANFKLRRQGNITHVTLRTEVSSDSKAFAFSLPVLKVLARRELQTDLQALKVAVEHDISS